MWVRYSFTKVYIYFVLADAETTNNLNSLDALIHISQHDGFFHLNYFHMAQNKEKVFVCGQFFGSIVLFIFCTNVFMHIEHISSVDYYMDYLWNLWTSCSAQTQMQIFKLIFCDIERNYKKILSGFPDIPEISEKNWNANSFSVFPLFSYYYILRLTQKRRPYHKLIALKVFQILFWQV